MTLDGTIVFGSGRTPNRVLLVGEAPGREEAAKRRPFVGRSGREQDWYLRPHSLHSSQFYKTNVVKEFREGNPNPTPSQIEEWTPILEAEVEEVQPALVIAVGGFAARWFLGDAASMDLVHGLPHVAGAFDPTRTNRSRGAIVVPVYHPAFGLRKGEMRADTARDYAKAVEVLGRLAKGDPIPEALGRTPPPEGHYSDASGDTVARWLGRYPPRVLAIDTEGTPDRPWSIQLSDHPGYAIVLRYSQPDFEVGARAIQDVVDAGALIVLHDATTPMGCSYDVMMCRAMGVDLSRARTWNTMYAGYLTHDAQALKTLMWRNVGMRQENYEALVADAATDRQIDYLVGVAEGGWPKPKPREERLNDGTVKVKKPTSIQARANSILADWASGKVDKDGNGVDLVKRWKAVEKDLRPELIQVREVVGEIPKSSLDDLPLEDAIRYAAMDADGTRRIYDYQVVKVEEMDLVPAMEHGMAFLPAVELIQSSGLTASKSRFEELQRDLDVEMGKVREELSREFYSGRPINPGSDEQVRTLMRRQGVRGKKRTSTGKMSTSKLSAEHLRFENDAMDLVFTWREYQKIWNTFCKPTLDRMLDMEPLDGTDGDLYLLRSVFKPTRTTARRLASENPNFQQVPVRSEWGRKVRACYVAPEGYLLGGADQSQIEMRFAAHESKDELLCKLFYDRRDVHAETAARIFGKRINERAKDPKERYADVDPLDERRPAKTAGFGILYGIQGEALLTQLQMMGCKGWDREKCDELIEEWLKVYSGVKEEIRRTAAECRRMGYVRTPGGMYRFLPGINHYESGVRAEAERLAFSHRIQGGAQELMQRAMVWLHKEVLELRDGGVDVAPCLQVHDEEVLRFEEGAEELVRALTLEALTEHVGMELRVPVEAEWHSGRTWADLK